jgi:transposase InsO family protein
VPPAADQSLVVLLRTGAETDETLALMTVIDETFMECPWHGSRQMTRHLRRAGHEVGRRRVRRLMAKMGVNRPAILTPFGADRLGKLTP